MTRSVEVRICECGWLEEAHDSSLFPITFDARTNEYNLRLGDGVESEGEALLYFCPFCGCKAPKSKASLLLTEIGQEEHRRLRSLVEGLVTFDQTISRLGEPDEFFPANHDTGQVMEMSYHSLSDVAVLRCFETNNGCINIQFERKYLGRKRNDEPT